MKKSKPILEQFDKEFGSVTFGPLIKRSKWSQFVIYGHIRIFIEKAIDTVIRNRKTWKHWEEKRRPEIIQEIMSKLP